VLGWNAELRADSPMHEFFTPDPAEDLRLGATTPSGRSPAALATPSGVVGALARGTPALVYGGAHTSNSVDASFHVDRLTEAPRRVSYDEPFRPSVLPFKRSYAFDRVREDFSLTVQDSGLRDLDASGQLAPGEEPFFADFEVDIVPGEAVRIPSVGPGAHVLSMESTPEGPLRLSIDGAENWFVRGARSGRVHLLLQLGWLPRVPGREFANADRARLASLAGPLPARVSEAAGRVKSALGLGADDPYTTLERLIAHFRSFQASDEPPVATDPAALYVELSLSKKGVCRHRAFAFLVTAISLGIPSRLVHNEAHAWVEVSDGSRWFRIDLGGAPAELSTSAGDDRVPPHRPPRDPFAWPSGSGSGVELAARQSGESGPSSWPSAVGAAPAGPSSSGAGPGSGSVDGAALAPPARPGAAERVELRLERATSRRGGLLGVEGTARVGDAACARARVDIEWLGETERRWLGSLATDATGRFRGQISLPLDLPVGSSAVTAKVADGCSGR
jgi:hypothetical protein